MYYVITATVDTINIRTESGDLRGLCVIPEFLVKAASREKAVSLARDIVDPMAMTSVHITVAEYTGQDLGDRDLSDE